MRRSTAARACERAVPEAPSRNSRPPEGRRTATTLPLRTTIGLNMPLRDGQIALSPASSVKQDRSR